MSRGKIIGSLVAIALAVFAGGALVQAQNMTSGGDGANDDSHDFGEIASSPAFAEAPVRRTRLWQAGLRAGRPDFVGMVLQ